MHEIHINSLFQCSAFTADRIPDQRDHLARRIAGLGVSILEHGAIYWGPPSHRTVIEAPAVFWVWEGKFCHYGCLPDHIWENAYSHICGDIAGELVEAGLFPVSDTPFVRLPPDSPVFGWFHAMLDLHQSDPVGTRDQCLWYLIGIGLELKKRREQPEPRDWMSRELAALKQRIFAYPLEQYDFGAIAQRYRICEKHFARRFAEVNALTPHSTVIHARLRLAMEHLLNNRSVKEAASAAGFGSASYFSRMFKKYYRLTPAEVSRSGK